MELPLGPPQGLFPRVSEGPKSPSELGGHASCCDTRLHPLRHLRRDGVVRNSRRGKRKQAGESSLNFPLLALGTNLCFVFGSLVLYD